MDKNNFITMVFLNLIICQLWDFSNKSQLSLYILVYSSTRLSFQKENLIILIQEF